MKRFFFFPYTHIVFELLKRLLLLYIRRTVRTLESFIMKTYSNGFRTYSVFELSCLLSSIYFPVVQTSVKYLLLLIYSRGVRTLETFVVLNVFTRCSNSCQTLKGSWKRLLPSICTNPLYSTLP